LSPFGEVATIQVNHSFDAYIFDESGVVTDDNQGAAEALQRGNQFFDARQVEIVRRLVRDQYFRRLIGAEQTGQARAHSLPAAQD